MSDLADKHNYGIDTYLNNMLASRMEPLKNMPGYIDIQTYADLDKDVPENKAADLRIRIPLDMRTEATCRTQTVQSLRRAQIALREIGVALHAASPERIIVTRRALHIVGPGTTVEGERRSRHRCHHHGGGNGDCSEVDADLGRL